MKPRLLELCAGEGGATKGYQRAGWYVTAVDNNPNALNVNPADEVIEADALDFLARYWQDYDGFHASFPCERWAANGANPAASKWPDLIHPGRLLLQSTGRPWVMENVPKAPLNCDLVLCGTQFDLTAVDDDGTLLHLKRHRVFESNVMLISPGPCRHPRGVQWAGVYGGARSDKHEARHVRKGGYAPKSERVQSELLGGVPWMTAKGRRQCIPPVYGQFIGEQLLAALAVAA